jgi:hypothetical protein
MKANGRALSIIESLLLFFLCGIKILLDVTVC